MKHRLLRVNELLKRELSILLVREITFDDLLVTVNQVDVTPDLKSAHVYVSVLGGTGGKEVLPKLEANRAALQAGLDDSIERGSRVLEILQEIEPPSNAETK